MSKRARRLGWLLGLLAVASFTGLGWANALGEWWVKATIIALFSASIALLGASSSGFRDRLVFGLLGAVIAWVGLILVGSAVTLAKLGHFEEGGPVGLALALGLYLGLPIAILASALTLLWSVAKLPPVRRGERT